MLSLVVKDNPRSIKTEAYRALKTNLQFLVKTKNLKKIMITSSENDDGKSSIISNLAFSFSQSGKKVLLVDCNFRKPYIHQYFNISNDLGISDLITEQLNYKEVLYEYSDTLHIITAGRIEENPSELLDVDSIPRTFGGFEMVYDLIFIDSPPVVNFTDSQILSTASDGVIMVLNTGRTRKKVCNKAIQMLNNVNANIIGMVVNEDRKLDIENYKSNQYYQWNDDKNKKRKSKKKRVAAV